MTSSAADSYVPVLPYYMLLQSHRASDEATYVWATEVLFEVRKQRSEAKQPLKVPIAKVTVKAGETAVALMQIVEADLKSALRVRAFESSVGDPTEILVHGYEPGPQG